MSSSYKYLFAALLGLSACNLVNVTDVAPIGQVDEHAFIVDIPTAEQGLKGAYSNLNSGLNFIVFIPGYTAAMGLSIQVSPDATNAGITGLANHTILPEDGVLSEMYMPPYTLIGAANQVIEKTARLTVESPRKQEIISEARFLRAMGHFYLLRLFGQFYDNASKYGVVLRDAPVADIRPLPRSTVKATYDLILADLDAAIAGAPAFTVPSSGGVRAIYASKELAQAYKAKVLLYKGDYAAAATLARAVIDGGKFKLEDNYEEIFKQKFASREVIFATPFDEKNERNNKAFSYPNYVGQPSANYVLQFTAKDKRFAASIEIDSTGKAKGKKFKGGIVNKQTLTADTEYFLRLSELMFIYAEAVVRASNDLPTAADMVNKLRKRAGLDEVTFATKAAALATIRQEKFLELGAESGEEWYDLVRYAVKGDLNIKDFKPTIHNPTQYILPIPFVSLQASGGVVEQNPGY